MWASKSFTKTGVRRLWPFSHGWPLSSDAREDQMLFLRDTGYRCIAHKRRAHSLASLPWHGNDLNPYAEDLAALFQRLYLKNAVREGL